MERREFGMAAVKFSLDASFSTASGNYHIGSPQYRTMWLKPTRLPCSRGKAWPLVVWVAAKT